MIDKTDMTEQEIEEALEREIMALEAMRDQAKDEAWGGDKK